MLPCLAARDEGCTSEYGTGNANSCISAGLRNRWRAALAEAGHQALDAATRQVAELADGRWPITVHCSRWARTMARAIGCSEADSNAAATASTSAGSEPGRSDRRAGVTRLAPRTSCTDIWPVVRVPVLSKTTVSTRRARSSTCGPRMTVPSWAPRPVPTMRADGVASPSAHGQAMISTAMAADSDIVTPLPTRRCPARVSTAITSTMGTKMPETLSARRCTSALPVWASSTMAGRSGPAGTASRRPWRAPRAAPSC